MSNKTIAIVVTYNRKELLMKCIGKLLNQTSSGLDVVVVDNASTDGTQKEVKDAFSDNKRVIYVNTGSNLGGAGGFSFGIKWAVNNGYDYLWIMDDDTMPTETALEELEKAHDILDGNYGFLSSYARWIDGTACEMNVPNLSNGWRKDIDVQFNNSMIQLESASFVSMYMKAETVKEVGLPIKEFFIWSDDVEYTKRISKKYPSYFVYNSQVVHEMQSNQATSIVESDSDRLQRYGYLYRNKYYIAKHSAKREKILFWLQVKNTIKDIFKSSCDKKMKRCGIVVRSCFKGLFFNPKIEYVDNE